MKMKKALKIFLPAFVAVSIIVTAVSIKAKADMVVIDEQKECDLTYLSLEGRYNDNVWINQGSLEKSGNNYILKSNGNAQWGNTDSLSMGYKHVKFNYSKKVQLTVETTMTSFDGFQTNAGAGLMIRSGTNPESACIMIHYRPNYVIATYRMMDGKDSKQGKTLTADTSGMYPVTFKAVVIKGESKVYTYYKIKNGEYVEFASIPFVYANDLYIGISGYSQLESHTATAVFSSFGYKLEGPDDYKVVDDNTSSDSSSSGSSSSSDIYPEDYPVSADTLMYESFTDGSMTNNNGDKQNDITNPIWDIWDTAEDSIEIKSNENKANRYLSEYMLSHRFYTVGDQSWTDYNMSADFRFTREYSKDEANNLVFMIRHTDIDQYGHQFYYVSFQKYNKKNVLAIGLVDSAKFPYNNMTIIPETVVEFDYLSSDFIDKWHTIDISAFDNVITVSVDGTELTKYTDNSALCKTEGNIGLMTDMAAVDIDNIRVTKLEDLLGGDYDNRIGGNWDQPMPKYLENFSKKELPY